MAIHKVVPIVELDLAREIYVAELHFDSNFKASSKYGDLVKLLHCITTCY